MMAKNQGESVVVQMSCAVCQNSMASRCAACGKVGYCSKAHQKEHWKVHKSDCQAWKILESEELGRYLIAVRDIKPGEIILKESALIVCPPRVTLPVCLGCYTEFEEVEVPSNVELQQFPKPHPCPNNCGFPTCGSTTCNKSDAHAPECSAAWSRGGVKIRNFGNLHPTYEAIGILRMLALKENNIESYSKLMSLKFHPEGDDLTDSKNNSGAGDSQTEELRSERRKNALRTVTLIQDFFRKNDVSKDEILTMLSILETNGQEIPIPDVNGQISRHLIGVYHMSSLFEHNCIPNCVKTWNCSSSNTYEIQIRASTAIQRGNHLSISYIDPMWGTVDRVHFLQSSKNFTCHCTRCVDPTELSTHFSSVRCQHAGCLAQMESHCTNFKGLIVPEDPYIVEMDWKCNSCGEIYSPGYVMSIVEKVGRELEKLHEKYGDIEAEEEFIKRFSKVLSPHHFYLLEIKLGLAQIYGRTQDEPLPLLSPRKILRKRQLCEELINIFNVILPGFNRLRALILYELQASVATLSKMRRAVEEISNHTHREELGACRKWLLEAVTVLGWEHENSIERRRADGGVHELIELKQLIQGCNDLV